jgi:galactose mutarotase-like enzyme
MILQRHLLIDANESVLLDGAEFSGTTGDRSWRVRLRTLRGGRSEGVHVVEIDNGHLCIDVLPTRGMGIWRVRRGDTSPSPSRGGARGGAVLGWRSPTGSPVHPAFVPLFEPSGLGWLDGFNELLCRCGLESNGPPEFDDAGRLLHPLHGRIANMPAHRVELIVDEDAGQLTLRGFVDESRFHFQSLRLTASVSTSLGSNEFTWNDEVENIGGRDATLQMLYHFNLGQPLLQPGARITAPVATVAPLTEVAASEGIERWNIMPPPRPGSAEQVYLLDLAADDAGDTCVLVSGLTDDEAVSLRFNKRTLPCFTVWRNTPAEIDGYVLGIEPGTNFPNPRTFEQQHGRAVSLKPGETWRAAVTATWHTDAESVADEHNAIREIQGRRKTNFAASPRGDWSVNA